MKKILRVLVFLEVIFALGLGALFLLRGDPSQAEPKDVSRPAFTTANIIITTPHTAHTLTVEVADDVDERAHGLMHVRNLPHDGMLFWFGESRHISMWMKNTFVSLDMLFLNNQGQIVHIAANTTPEDTTAIHSGGPVSAVLELPAGKAKELGISQGDTVNHPFLNK